MTESENPEYSHGYKCPSCDAIGGHTRTRFGPPGDAKNLERYCRNCSKRFITAHTEFVDLEYGREHSESFCPECGSETFVQRPKAEDECLVCPYTEEETNPPVSETQKQQSDEGLQSKNQQPNVSPDAWLCDSLTIDSDGRHETKSAHVEKQDYDSEEPLYSSETITQVIQEMKEEMGEKPSGFDRLDRNAWKERRKTLEELEQVFSE